MPIKFPKTWDPGGYFLALGQSMFDPPQLDYSSDHCTCSSVRWETDMENSGTQRCKNVQICKQCLCKKSYLGKTLCKIYSVLLRKWVILRFCAFWWHFWWHFLECCSLRKWVILRFCAFWWHFWWHFLKHFKTLCYFLVFFSLFWSFGPFTMFCCK